MGLPLLCQTIDRNRGAFTHWCRAVKDGNDMEAREHIAFANTMSGYSMVVGSCTSEHAMEHAMSAYHQTLPHGAGLIMISREYYTHFVNKHCCDERFVRMAQALGKTDAKAPIDFVTALVELQKACGVYDLKMSDYGIQKNECMTLAQNARATMGGLFDCDPIALPAFATHLIDPAPASIPFHLFHTTILSK